MAVACAALLHHPGELLDAIAADLARRPSQYDCLDYTGVVWALTRLGRSPGPLWALLAAEVGGPLGFCSRECNASVNYFLHSVNPTRLHLAVFV